MKPTFFLYPPNICKPFLVAKHTITNDFHCIHLNLYTQLFEHKTMIFVSY